ncbi:MAG: hypothetical protein IK149_01690 [Oscillospiraceae bacterium]|nr:hypothetical protein [Oscillospiraceae bacterium]
MRSYDDWKNADMRCCFFRTQNKEAKRIGCEGFFERSTITHTFRRKKEFDEQLTEYCAGDYEKCPYYRVLEIEKYSEK